MSFSLEILREQGPMTLRELTGATAQRLGAKLKYDDVAAVMQRHLDEGTAQRTDAEDWRDRVWSVKA